MDDGFFYDSPNLPLTEAYHGFNLALFSLWATFPNCLGCRVR